MERPDGPSAHTETTSATSEFLRRAWDIPAHDLIGVVDVARELLGAESATFLVADYGLLSLQALGANGPTGDAQSIHGTLAGRAFAHGEIVTSGSESAEVYLPVTDGSERVGVLQIVHDHWDDAAAAIADSLTHLLVLLLVSKRRYTDTLLRSRRAQPLSPAAEMQWGLLPPLACSAEGFALSGILEPAYSIGGDTFDYALDSEGVRFAIIDAVGHGMPAVLISVAAINALRNARREAVGIAQAYAAAGAVLETQFGQGLYATGQIGELDVATGQLSWLNAGHPLPLLVRDGHVRELACAVSWPMGLGGAVTEVAVERLQPRDSVLFYTDGAVDSRAAGGAPFGLERLIDQLAVAVQERVGPAETVRRLSTSIVAHNDGGLTDDSTLLLLEYHGPDQ